MLVREISESLSSLTSYDKSGSREDGKVDYKFLAPGMRGDLEYIVRFRWRPEGEWSMSFDTSDDIQLLKSAPYVLAHVVSCLEDFLMVERPDETVTFYGNTKKLERLYSAQAGKINAAIGPLGYGMSEETYGGAKRFYIRRAIGESAEDGFWAWARSNPHVYHASPVANRASIGERGLTSASGVARNGARFKRDINFARDMGEARGYAGGGDIYRVRHDLLRDPTYDPIAGYVRTSHDVPPEHIEIFRAGRWQKLKGSTA